MGIILLRIKKNNISSDKIEIADFQKEAKINEEYIEKKFISYQKCYISPDNSNLNIVHLIITRFFMTFWKKNGFPNILLNDDYISNSFRVMKKYLVPSLENQSCKNFTWILLLGKNANITLVKSFFNFNPSFKYEIIFQKDLKHYIKNKIKGSDILITTRIDYDDRIYYDAVNDIRKVININKPMIIYGYNRGFYYYELDGNYYDFYKDYNKTGVMSVFATLIIVLNKVNDLYIVFDFGDHSLYRKTILKNYQSYGIKKLDYEPAIFDSGSPKFVWVRQKYSGSYNQKSKLQNKLNRTNFSLSEFYGE